MVTCRGGQTPTPNLAQTLRLKRPHTHTHTHTKRVWKSLDYLRDWCIRGEQSRPPKQVRRDLEEERLSLRMGPGLDWRFACGPRLVWFESPPAPEEGHLHVLISCSDTRHKGKRYRWGLEADSKHEKKGARPFIIATKDYMMSFKVSAYYRLYSLMVMKSINNKMPGKKKPLHTK